MKKLLKLLGGLVALLVLVAVALLAWLYAQGRQPLKTGAEYVAMGSSFAAGPGLGDNEPGSPAFCSRSTRNYAHRVAASLGLSLSDVSCGGATTSHILRGGQLFQGSQIDAVGPATKLVTVTIGGNDINYIGGLGSWACQTGPDHVFPLWRPLACMKFKVGSPEDLQKTRAALIEIAALVHQRAPQAQLIFVDYATVLPPAGSCPERLPLSEAQMAEGRSVAMALNRITAEAADSGGDLLVKASELTAAHDICAADSWIVPFRISVNPFATPALHPTEASMRAVAEEIIARVRRGVAQ